MDVVARQQPLPLPWQLVRPVAERDFAHPAELDFARILTFYRVRWSYEPTTFPLSFTEEGRPREMFTPDFYLPDHRLYIELTTMRQRLVTRKNRKIRQLRALYPNVRIKLLYRRDYHRLVDAYQACAERGGCRIGRVLFTAEQIAQRIADLAGAIADDMGSPPASRPSNGPAIEERRQPGLFPFLPAPMLPWPKGWSLTPAFLPSFLSLVGDGPPEEVPTGVYAASRWPPDDAPLLVLGVDRGSAVFLRHLTTALDSRGIPIEVDRVTVSRYRTPLGKRRVRIGRAPVCQVAGRRILVVADIVSTGLSLAYLTWWLRRRGARQVEVCTLLDRRAARLIDLPMRYVGFEAPNEMLVGFGLHLRRQYRNLPVIATLAAPSISGAPPGS